MSVDLPLVVRNAAMLAAVAVGALTAHLVLFRALFRFGWRTRTAAELQHRCRWPARASTVLLALILGLPILRLSADVTGPLRHGLVIGLIGTLAWLIIQATFVAEDAAAGRFDLTAPDNLLARRRATQAQVLRRVVVAVTVVLAIAAALLTFEGARTFGASLLASAGVIGIVAGVAARSTLGNLVAGIQVAFSEPIRLDDVVVVEGEWGRVEEITLTYVVLKLWDKRRLVLPTSYFVETPFQNWTRRNAQLLGAVELYVDYRTPVDAVRRELQRLVEASDLWDGETWVLQVTDATERTMKLRALATAKDAPTAWDLRCELREGLIAFLQREHPQALPVVRVESTSADGEPSDDGRARDGRDRVSGDGGPSAPLDERGRLRARTDDETLK